MKHPCLNAAAALALLLGFGSAMAEDSYTPEINPADFTTAISNPLFNMPVGKKWSLNPKLKTEWNGSKSTFPGRPGC